MMSVSVCVCLSAIISSELHISFFERVTCGHGLLLWPHNDTLLISGFMDDVLFVHKLLDLTSPPG